ncbi:hypothetical protein KKF34_18030 [Myxococcota bacterium]|nr:hypothetical protein [Myxococcota bacterium]MBU1498784.1 hypothetical protein [Myxococcota bacterium]
MNKERFANHLELATQYAIDFASRYIFNHLDGPGVYLVEPNCSYDKNLCEGEVVFPDDSLPEGKVHGPWTSEQVVDFLCREGRVPEWIDIAVAEVSKKGEVRIGLTCCGRFTALEDLLYYKDRETPPFGVKSPPLPPGWKEDCKFDVNWFREISTRRSRPWWRLW